SSTPRTTSAPAPATRPAASSSDARTTFGPAAGRRTSSRSTSAESGAAMRGRYLSTPSSDPSRRLRRLTAEVDATGCASKASAAWSAGGEASETIRDGHGWPISVGSIPSHPDAPVAERRGADEERGSRLGGGTARALLVLLLTVALVAGGAT